MVGQRADQQLGTERGLAQLGVGQPEVVAALDDVVGELVRQAEAETERRAVGPIR